MLCFCSYKRSDLQTFSLLEAIFLVLCDDGRHVAHATVAEFDIVAIEDFVKTVVAWKVFVQNVKKLFSDFRIDAVTVWRIKPNYFTLSLRFFLGGWLFGGREAKEKEKSLPNPLFCKACL